MNAEIIAIGSELLLGQIVDTNSAYIAKSLADNGIELVRTSTVEDDLGRIEQLLQEAISRSAIILTTGGLGPTEDDLTRESIAQVTQRPLVLQPHLLEQIEGIFKRRGFRMTENNQKQAYIPEGAIPIENPKGTAPGFIVEGSTYVTISLPGVPLEMKYLMEDAVIPYLRRHFNLQREIIRYKVLRACGLGESAIGAQIADLMRDSKNPAVGTLASVGDIQIRITAKAHDPEEAQKLIEAMEKEIRMRLGTVIYGIDKETLQGNVAKLLEKFDLTLSVAETFTGGILSQKLIATESCSFTQGVVLAMDRSLRDFLDLKEGDFESIASEPKSLADSLAARISHLCRTNLGLAVVAKPLEKQKEDEYRFQTHYSISTSGGLERQEVLLGGEAALVRERASIIALDLLRKYLMRLDR